ncbi:MAG TPA: hypothetical protein P5556_01240 [Candidatus Gastranaerophilales bacterium]|nr:hypothetical protein [Candidatus Gastranaerophilales bacterium]
MNISKVAKTTIRPSEALISQLPYEGMVVIDNAGKVVLLKKGERSRVVLNAEEVYDLSRRKPQSIMTHNHPSGGPLSPEDIYFAFKTKLREVRAVSPDNTVYLMEMPKKLNPNDYYKGIKESLRFAKILEKAKTKGLMKLEKDYTTFYRFMTMKLKHIIPGLKFRTLI